MNASLLDRVVQRHHICYMIGSNGFLEPDVGPTNKREAECRASGSIAPPYSRLGRRDEQLVLGIIFSLQRFQNRGVSFQRRAYELLVADEVAILENEKVIERAPLFKLAPQHSKSRAAWGDLQGFPESALHKLPGDRPRSKVIMEVLSHESHRQTFGELHSSYTSKYFRISFGGS